MQSRGNVWEFLTSYRQRPYHVLLWSTATMPASEGEAVVRSPTNMAAAKIAAVDFKNLY